MFHGWACGTEEKAMPIREEATASFPAVYLK